MTEPPLVRLDHVGVTFPNGVEALRDLSFAVARGEFVSLLGPSGCGKSTALRLLAGLERPSQGQLVWQEPVAQSRLGFVFQEPTLMPWARVFDNVYLPLRLLGMSRPAAREKVETVLRQVGLADFSHVFPRELSGGMKMRASIARALVTEPSLLLLDEPFAALDEITRHKLNGDVRALWERQRVTTLFVTHSIYESVFLSNRILVLSPRPGRIVAEIAIAPAQPRDEAFRTSAQFAQYCRDVAAALAAAMAGGTTGAPA